MAGADTQSPPIESRADLIEAMERGCKPEAAWRVGTEHEKFVFRRETNAPVPYAGDDGIGGLLAFMREETGGTPLMDGEAVIGLELPDGGAISLEPGGQFELSGAPLATIHETAAETAEHMAAVRRWGAAHGVGFLGLGTTPTWSVRDMPKMPKSRYGIMTPYMDKVGTLGTSMMYRSCTVQANLDFSDEADMVKKLRVSVALQPVVTALFANSPFIDGGPSGFLSFRSHIWLNTDADRTGMLPFAFEPGMGFERYADYALDVPMYFVIRDGRYVNTSGQSFRDFLEGRLPALPGEKPTRKDWQDHLTTIFPEVRLKAYLEMRGADVGDEAMLAALPAVWAGLFYDRAALDAAWELVKDWTAEERLALRRGVPVTALRTPVREGIDVHAIAREVVALARQGLAARARLNATGEDETRYLEPLDEIVATGRTRAETWLDAYRGEWGGDISRAFEDCAY